jgi:hypothetical protein
MRRRRSEVKEEAKEEAKEEKRALEAAHFQGMLALIATSSFS